MTDATASSPTCRLCGCAIRPADDAALLAGEYFHAPCAEPAFSGTPASISAILPPHTDAIEELLLGPLESAVSKGRALFAVCD